MSTIILDFDYTLLDTTAFSQALASSLGLTREQWLAAYRGFVQDNGFFSATDFLQGVPDDQRKAFLQVTKQTWQFLYPDTVPFLKKIIEAGHRPVIVTFGETDWQTAKLAGANLPKGIESVVVSDRKVNHLSKYAEADMVVVDDRSLELDPIAGQYPKAKLIWMCRPGGAHVDEQPQAVHTKVTSLSEINL